MRIESISPATAQQPPPAEVVVAAAPPPPLVEFNDLFHPVAKCGVMANIATPIITASRTGTLTTTISTTSLPSIVTANNSCGSSSGGAGSNEKSADTITTGAGLSSGILTASLLAAAVVAAGNEPQNHHHHQQYTTTTSTTKLLAGIVSPSKVATVSNTAMTSMSMLTSDADATQLLPSTSSSSILSAAAAAAATTSQTATVTATTLSHSAALVADGAYSSSGSNKEIGINMLSTTAVPITPATSTAASSAQMLLNGLAAGCTSAGSCSSNVNATSNNNFNNQQQHQQPHLQPQQHHHHHQQQHQLLSDDSRALQLALELSMAGLNDVAAPIVPTSGVPATMQYLHNLQQLHHNQQQQQQHMQQQHQQQQHHNQQPSMQQHQQQESTQAQQQQQFDLNTLSAISAAVAAAAAAANQQQQQLDLSNSICSSSPAAATAVVNNTVSSLNGNHQVHSYGTTNATGMSGAAPTGLLLPTLEDRSKKSQNMTECVPVPSSEHVAEIVGRQGKGTYDAYILPLNAIQTIRQGFPIGCKIKALRAKTNTYIKTPVRGEEPVFVVTGRKEDVAKAKREILSAAEHFSLIRATRKPSYDGSTSSVLNGGGTSGCHSDAPSSGTANNANSGVSGLAGGNCGGVGVGSGGINGSKSPPGPPCIPGQVTIQVRVPYRVVGLVVGPKGATIKHIQQETQTYVVTPSREKEPIFEVTGLPDNVQTARKQIEAHIALRTGNLPNSSSSSPAVTGGAASTNGLSISDTTSLAGIGGVGGIGGGVGCVIDPTLHTINTLSQILNDDINPDFLVSLYKNGICSTFDYVENTNNTATPTNGHGSLCGSVGSGGAGGLTSINMNTQSLVLGSSLISGNPHHHQQQQYTNDYLHSLLGNGHANTLDTEMQTQSAHLQQQQQHIHHQIHNRAVIPIGDNAMHVATITNSSTHLPAATTTVKPICTDPALPTASNGITRSCSSASSTTSSKSGAHYNNSNIMGCVGGNIGIGVGDTINSSGIVSSSVGVGVGGNNGDGISSNSSSSSSNSSTASSRPELINIWKHLSESIDVDEGIGESPNIWMTSMPATAATAALQTVAVPTVNGVRNGSPQMSNSPTDSLLGEINTTMVVGSQQQQHFSNGLLVRGVNNINCSSALLQLQQQQQQQHHMLNNAVAEATSITSILTTSTTPSSSTPTTTTTMNSLNLGMRRECMICSDKEVTAALVPCGHNMFCMECAKRICNSSDASCPVCSVNVYHAMRILA